MIRSIIKTAGSSIGVRLARTNQLITKMYSTETIATKTEQPTTPIIEPIPIPEQVVTQSPEAVNFVPKTHFGFKAVDLEAKEGLVAQVFSSVASKYDVMNDFMSVGIHRLWKDYFIQQMAPGPGTKLLDVAGGTGDIALRFLNYCQEMHGDRSANVKVIDINPDMLAHGQQRYIESNFSKYNQAEFRLGNAEHLEGVEDSSVDVYTISFGIRNCTHVDKVLSEAYRVLRPGGRLMVLEFSKVEAPLFKQIYDLHSFYVIPEIGHLVTNDRESYKYLVESIRQFPNQETFAEMIRNAGFSTVGKGYENLTLGVAAIHTGYKF